ncbi:unnamed protein product, partial [Staurois parvus]
VSLIAAVAKQCPSSPFKWPGSVPDRHSVPDRRTSGPAVSLITEVSMIATQVAQQCP